METAMDGVRDQNRGSSKCLRRAGVVREESLNGNTRCKEHLHLSGHVPQRLLGDQVMVIQERHTLILQRQVAAGTLWTPKGREDMVQGIKTQASWVARDTDPERIVFRKILRSSADNLPEDTRGKRSRETLCRYRSRRASPTRPHIGSKVVKMTIFVLEISPCADYRPEASS